MSKKKTERAVAAALSEALQESQRNAILTAINGLVQIRAMCTDSIEVEEVIKTPETRQWVRQLAHHVRTIENGLRISISPFIPSAAAPMDHASRGEGGPKSTARERARPGGPDDPCTEDQD